MNLKFSNKKKELTLNIKVSIKQPTKGTHFVVVVVFKKLIRFIQIIFSFDNIFGTFLRRETSLFGYKKK